MSNDSFIKNPLGDAKKPNLPFKVGIRAHDNCIKVSSSKYNFVLLQNGRSEWELASEFVDIMDYLADK